MLFPSLLAGCAAVAYALGPRQVAAAGGSRSASEVEVLEIRRQQQQQQPRPLVVGLSSRKFSPRRLPPVVINTPSRQKRGLGTEEYRTNASLEISWNDAELYSFGFMSVSCSTCYVKGTAYASLVLADDFNITGAFVDFINAFGKEVANITEQVWDQFQNWAEFVFKNATDIVGHDIVDFFTGKFDDFDAIHWDDYEFPTIKVNFDMELKEIADAMIELKFDELELYMMLDVKLAAKETYTIPLYPKDWIQPAGLALGGHELGLIISLDLILELDTEVDMQTGVHIAFKDGLGVQIALFGRNVSSVKLTEGSFEFLPVTVNTSGVVFDATLRLGVTTGLNMTAQVGDFIRLGAGASAGVFTDLARFRTNVTPTEGSLELTKRVEESQYPKDCKLPVVETYELGVGAKAGAFVRFNHDTWGPSPNTSIQLFYTTLFSACAIPAAATPTNGGGGETISGALLQVRQTAAPNNGLEARADKKPPSNVTTLTSVYTVTNIVCQTTGLRDCPASLQSTAQTTKTATAVVTTNGTGGKATFPTTMATGAVPTTQAFGTGAQTFASSSGAPVSYVPPAETGGGAGGIAGIIGSAGRLSGMDGRLVVGLSVGLGGGLVLGLVAFACIFCSRRRASRARAPVADTQLLVGEDRRRKARRAISKRSHGGETRRLSTYLDHQRSSSNHETPDQDIVRGLRQGRGFSL